MALALDKTGRLPQTRPFLILSNIDDQIKFPRVVDVRVSMHAVLDLGADFFFDFDITSAAVRMREVDMQLPLGSVRISGSSLVMAAAAGRSNSSFEAVFVDLQSGAIVEASPSPGSAEVWAWTLMLLSGLEGKAPLRLASWHCETEND